MPFCFRLCRHVGLLSSLLRHMMNVVTFTGTYRVIFPEGRRRHAASAPRASNRNTREIFSIVTAACRVVTIRCRGAFSVGLFYLRHA